LQWLYISIHSSYSIFLNFLIRFQSIAETGSSISTGGFSASSAAACYKEGSIDAKGGYKASSNKETLRGRPPGPPLPLYGALFRVYNNGVYR
jgi:hypothetical protein